MDLSTSGSFWSDDTDVSIDHYDVVIGNLKHLRSNESFNDVQFSLRDGKVHANSVIMSMSSDYFATMISNEKFIEGQTKDIPMKEYGTKKAMESIVEYVYSGKMNLETQGFETLLEILNILKMMLMRRPTNYPAALKNTSISTFTEGIVTMENCSVGIC